MTRALRAVQNGTGIRKAARLHEIPYGTLQDHIKGKFPANFVERESSRMTKKRKFEVIF